MEMMPSDEGGGATESGSTATTTPCSNTPGHSEGMNSDKITT